MLRDSLIEEFDERIKQSYEWLIEQQMSRLKRIQIIKMEYN